MLHHFLLVKLSVAGFLVGLPTVANADCFEKAGKLFDVNPQLLKAICFTESSFRTDAVNPNNHDGSIDVGYCQINSWWYPKLEQYGITQESLLNDPCENTQVAAWILAQNYATSGYNWTAVGAYNAGYGKSQEKEAARQAYIERVKQNMENMQ